MCFFAAYWFPSVPLRGDTELRCFQGYRIRESEPELIKPRHTRDFLSVRRVLFRLDARRAEAFRGSLMAPSARVHHIQLSVSVFAIVSFSLSLANETAGARWQSHGPWHHERRQRGVHVPSLQRPGGGAPHHPSVGSRYSKHPSGMRDSPNIKARSHV